MSRKYWTCWSANVLFGVVISNLLVSGWQVPVLAGMVWLPWALRGLAL